MFGSAIMIGIKDGWNLQLANSGRQAVNVSGGGDGWLVGVVGVCSDISYSSLAE